MSLLLLFLGHLSLCLRADAALGVPNRRSEAPPPYDAQIDDGTYGYYPARTYATEGDLTSPQTNFIQWDPRCDDGSYYFLAPRGPSLSDPGPMILDARGELVWTKHFDNQFGGQAYDAKVQMYHGEKYLTFWMGDDGVRGHGSGAYYMLDSTYNIVHSVNAGNGLSADLHEFLITPEGTALLTIYEVIEYDVTNLPGYQPDPENPDQLTYIWDCLIQEVDIETENLVFEWRASDYIPVNETYRPTEGGSKDDPFDWFHLNSIQKDDMGNYLISARFTHSVTYIDGVTGDIIWTLGGQHNDFMDLSNGDGLSFSWQHDARFIPLDTFPHTYHPPEPLTGFSTTLMTLFDNAGHNTNYDYSMDYARGLVLELTFPTPHHQRRDASQEHNGRDAEAANEEAEVDLLALKLAAINGTNPDFTVRVIKSYDSPEGLHASSQGSLQILQQGLGEDANALVGFGVNPIWAEYDTHGNVLCHAHYGANISWERGDVQSYRIYKYPWIGNPESPPKIAVNDDNSEVFVSWNGATEVAYWILQCAELDTEDDDYWADLVQVRKRGFETLIPLSEDVGTARYLRIIALDHRGRRFEHGTSSTIDRVAAAARISHTIPYDIAGLPSQRILLILIANIVIIAVLWEIYRRYFLLRACRSSLGILRWGKEAIYQPLGNH